MRDHPKRPVAGESVRAGTVHDATLSRLGRVLRWGCWCLAASTFAVLIAVVAAPVTSGGSAVAVTTGSMQPALMPGSLVINRGIAAEDACDTVRVGDIATYTLNGSGQVTHRVIGIDPTATESGPSCRFILQGDANAQPDAQVEPPKVRGVMLFALPVIGWLWAALTPAGAVLALLALVGVFATTAGAIGRTSRSSAGIQWTMIATEESGVPPLVADGGQITGAAMGTTASLDEDTHLHGDYAADRTEMPTLSSQSGPTFSPAEEEPNGATAALEGADSVGECSAEAQAADDTVFGTAARETGVRLDEGEAEPLSSATGPHSSPPKSRFAIVPDGQQANDEARRPSPHLGEEQSGVEDDSAHEPEFHDTLSDESGELSKREEERMYQSGHLTFEENDIAGGTLSPAILDPATLPSKPEWSSLAPEAHSALSTRPAAPADHTQVANSEPVERLRNALRSARASQVSSMAPDVAARPLHGSDLGSAADVAATMSRVGEQEPPVPVDIAESNSDGRDRLSLPMPGKGAARARDLLARREDALAERERLLAMREEEAAAQSASVAEQSAQVGSRLRIVSSWEANLDAREAEVRASENAVRLKHDELNTADRRTAQRQEAVEQTERDLAAELERVRVERSESEAARAAVEAQRAELENWQVRLDALWQELQENETRQSEFTAEVADQAQQLREAELRLSEKDAALRSRERELDSRADELLAQHAEISDRAQQVHAEGEQLSRRANDQRISGDALERERQALEQRERNLEDRERAVETWIAQQNSTSTAEAARAHDAAEALAQRERKLDEQRAAFEKAVAEVERTFRQREIALTERERNVDVRDGAVEEPLPARDDATGEAVPPHLAPRAASAAVSNGELGVESPVGSGAFSRARYARSE